MKLILNLFPFKGPDLEATLKAIRSGKVTDEDVGKLMQVFETTGNSLTTYFFVNLYLKKFYFFLGIVSSAGGVTRLRKMSDLRKTLEATSQSFDAAIEAAQNRETPQSKNFN